jgi:hypothetical protein
MTVEFVDRDERNARCEPEPFSLISFVSNIAFNRYDAYYYNSIGISR